ncbi:transposase family protein [Enterococcus sp. 12F9_DIV0723]|uniref:transposase family protein n=1 Tax=Enterococcus sp. 12F9_DIV0723 TaxID=1834169 RepID=UPI000B3EB19F
MANDKGENQLLCFFDFYLAKCPRCCCEFNNFHDSYTIQIQGLPIQSKIVYLNILSRRIKCQNPSVSKK